MRAARPDQKVLGFLGRALSLELSAVQQYSTQARLAGSWGLSEAAARFRKEADEELQHADRIIERMLAVGAAPGGSQLRQVKLAPNLLGLLAIDQQFEADVIAMYASAVGYCASISDHDSLVFFDELFREEQAHHRELEAWQLRLQQAPDQRTHGRR